MLCNSKKLLFEKRYFNLVIYDLKRILKIKHYRYYSLSNLTYWTADKWNYTIHSFYYMFYILSECFHVQNLCFPKYHDKIRYVQFEYFIFFVDKTLQQPPLARYFSSRIHVWYKYCMWQDRKCNWYNTICNIIINNTVIGMHILLHRFFV